MILRVPGMPIPLKSIKHYNDGPKELRKMNIKKKKKADFLQPEMKIYLLSSSWIKTVNPKGNQPWIFTERTNAEATIIWTPDTKIWLLGKDPDAGKGWRQEKKVTKDETIAWHHRLNGREFEQAPGDGDGQGSLLCCSPWGHKESDMT